MTFTVVWEHQAMGGLRRLREADPTAAEESAGAVRALADDPYPPEARALGALPTGDWAWAPGASFTAPRRRR